MRKNALAGMLLVGGVVLSSCAPAVAPTPPATLAPAVTRAPSLAPTPTAKVQEQAPAPRTAAPQLTPAPAPPTPVPPVAGKPQYGGILQTSNQKDLIHLDMLQETTAMLLMPLGPTYSLLVQNDPLNETKIIPDLAERWEVSPDGKTYTFYLRKGVNFHNGTPLTAADVKFSFERMVWPPKDIRSPRQSYYQALDRIELVDDYTIRMTTKYPQASFLQMVAEPRAFIYSKPVIEAKGDMKKDVMGSGPFKFKEYMRGVSFKVVRNPDYFLKDRPYLDGIDRYIISDFAAVHAAFKAGKLDILVGYQQAMSPGERKALKERYPEVGVQEVVSPTARTMLLNVTRPPFNDVRVRRAVSLALTRE
ncbi:MAG: ABC transporter substrate-binding protein, partial [Chloroflexota bacterium]|nr:ABC transporter substrate-binding protein [Chloroflexota bacterium]